MLFLQRSTNFVNSENDFISEVKPGIYGGIKDKIASFYSRCIPIFYKCLIFLRLRKKNNRK